MRSKWAVGLVCAGIIASGCTSATVGGDRPRGYANEPPPSNASLLDTLQRDRAVFVQPRFLFVLPAPPYIEFNSMRTRAPDASTPPGGVRKIWVLTNMRGEWAQILLFDATPKTPGGEVNAAESLLRYADAMEKTVKADTTVELRGTMRKGAGDRTDYRITEWDKQHDAYRKQRCVPSPEGRDKPVFVCVMAQSADTLAFDAVLRGIQFADHVPGFRLPPNLAAAVKRGS